MPLLGGDMITQRKVGDRTWVLGSRGVLILENGQQLGEIQPPHEELHPNFVKSKRLLLIEEAREIERNGDVSGDEAISHPNPFVAAEYLADFRTKLTEQQLAVERTRFGFVFQNAALFDSMTIAENILFPLKQNRPESWRQHEEEMLTHLSEVGLATSVLNKRPAELSGGMRKRVGLARALVMQPEVLLYDEPTTGLDPIVSDVINELMIRTRDRYSVTSIIVTHDMKTARKVADRVIMIYPLSRLDPMESQIIMDGSPVEVDASQDRRVSQFVRGEAGDRLMEMSQTM